MYVKIFKSDPHVLPHKVLMNINEQSKDSYVGHLCVGSLSRSMKKKRNDFNAILLQ